MTAGRVAGAGRAAMGGLRAPRSSRRGCRGGRPRAPLRPTTSSWAAPGAHRAPALLAALLAGAAAGCGSDGEDAPAPPALASVVVVYEAPTAIDPAVAAAFPACVQGVRHTHLHPSWRGFAGMDMSDGGVRWTLSFADVPVGTRERFRVNDPNVCDDHPTGAVTRDVFANGVRLTDVVDTPGTGLEPGFAFTVAADGTVTP